VIHFKPCEPEHIELIDTQEAQPERRAFNANVTAELVANSLALSCWIDDRCVGAGGVRPIWAHRMAAWTLLGKDAGPAMLAITRKLRFVLATVPHSRIEMTVRAGFGPGCRLATVLGFQCETPRPMPLFFPDGGAAYLYARVTP
jgi:hypothetical protein